MPNPAAREKFNPYRFLMAREVCGLNREELAAKLSIPLEEIAGIENGICEPRKTTIEHMCMLTGFLPKWFRLPAPPEFPMGTLLFHVPNREKPPP